ncbi:hypothetical protein [Salinispora cortesiana]|uniref:hypothetical protein n=1 Tax=Salinispora cortesiana TaxID=1305843 RepID=UPI0004153359|nr:hypothetical protein [Salinispora cortesiana]
MRARRLVAAVSLVVGLVALTGCRTEPGVAAYVGDQQITENTVDSLLDELRDSSAATEAPELGGLAPQPPSRSEVVSALVLGTVCDQVSADRGYQPQGRTEPVALAGQLGLPPESEYVRQLAALYTCLSGLPIGDSVAPTEQELADVIAAGRTAGVIPPDTPDAVVAGQLDGPQLRNGLASRRALAEAAGEYDVTVNPRYRPLEFPVLNFSQDVAAVSVLLGEPGSDAVTDVSSPEPLPPTGADQPA